MELTDRERRIVEYAINFLEVNFLDEDDFFFCEPTEEEYAAIREKLGKQPATNEDK